MSRSTAIVDSFSILKTGSRPYRNGTKDRFDGTAAQRVMMFDLQLFLSFAPAAKYPETGKKRLE